MLLLKKPVDHSQYVLTDGSRGLTSTISGVDPSSSYHLSTKNYVDSNIFDLLGRNKSGREQLGLGDSSTTVVFNTAFSSNDYALLISIENQIDSPSSEYAITITDKTVSGFTVNYSGDIDSNNYYLNWIATLSGSFSSGDYLASVVEDTSPQLGGNLDLDDYSVVLNTTPSGNYIHGYTVGWSGEMSPMVLDDNFEFASPLYMKSNGHMALCTAASGTTQMPCIALSLEEGTGTKKVLWGGIVRKGSWGWTPGSVIYVSTVEGALTSVNPNDTGDWQQPIGLATAVDTIKFNPGYDPGSIKSS